MDAERARVRVDQPMCPFCRAEIAAGEAQLACNACRAWHHRDCWAENAQRCGACGGQETGNAAAAAASVGAVTPTTAARRLPPVRYTDALGRRYEYRVPLGRWLLGKSAILGAAIGGLALAATLGQHVDTDAQALGLAALGLLSIVGGIGGLWWYERRTRRYLDGGP